MHAVGCLLFVLWLYGAAWEGEEALLLLTIPPQVEVAQDRFTLGEIATLKGGEPTLQDRLRAIELGASPAPGLSRSFTRTQLLIRLRQHGIATERVRLEMPERVQLVRRSQRLEPERPLAFAREQLRQWLGDEAERWEPESQPNALSLPDGELQLALDGQPQIGRTYARIGVQVLINGQPRGYLSCTFRAPTQPKKLMVRTGETVTVRVTAEALTVETIGRARASGAQNETIPVYLPATGKTVRARVVEPGVVSPIGI